MSFNVSFQDGLPQGNNNRRALDKSVGGHSILKSDAKVFTYSQAKPSNDASFEAGGVSFNRGNVSFNRGNNNNSSFNSGNTSFNRNVPSYNFGNAKYSFSNPQPSDKELTRVRGYQSQPYPGQVAAAAASFPQNNNTAYKDDALNAFIDGFLLNSEAKPSAGAMFSQQQQGYPDSAPYNHFSGGGGAAGNQLRSAASHALMRPHPFVNEAAAAAASNFGSMGGVQSSDTPAVLLKVIEQNQMLMQMLMKDKESSHNSSSQKKTPKKERKKVYFDDEVDSQEKNDRNKKWKEPPQQQQPPTSNAQNSLQGQATNQIQQQQPQHQQPQQQQQQQQQNTYQGGYQQSIPQPSSFNNQLNQGLNNNQNPSGNQFSQTIPSNQIGHVLSSQGYQPGMFNQGSMPMTSSNPMSFQYQPQMNQEEGKVMLGQMHDPYNPIASGLPKQQQVGYPSFPLPKNNQNGYSQWDYDQRDDNSFSKERRFSQATNVVAAGSPSSRETFDQKPLPPAPPRRESNQNNNMREEVYSVGSRASTSKDWPNKFEEGGIRFQNQTRDESSSSRPITEPELKQQQQMSYRGYSNPPQFSSSSLPQYNAAHSRRGLSTNEESYLGVIPPWYKPHEETHTPAKQSSLLAKGHLEESERVSADLGGRTAAIQVSVPVPVPKYIEKRSELGVPDMNDLAEIFRQQRLNSRAHGNLSTATKI